MQAIISLGKIVLTSDKNKWNNLKLVKLVKSIPIRDALKKNQFLHIMEYYAALKRTWVDISPRYYIVKQIIKV